MPAPIKIKLLGKLVCLLSADSSSRSHREPTHNRLAQVTKTF